MNVEASYFFNRALTVLLCLFLLDANRCLAERCVNYSEGSVRLVGFNSTLVGYVDVCKNETWMRLLTAMDSWTHKNSIVVCQQLGHLGALRLRDQSSIVQQVMDNKMGKTYMSATVECTGTEQTLSSCIRNPHSSPQGQQSQLSFVACREAPSKGDIRLVDVSSSDGEGVVEMYYPRRSYRWSTICTNGWGDVEAKIVCQQLGYQTGTSKFYGSLELRDEYELPRKRYDNFKCNGTEGSLSQCLNDGPYPYKCYSADYAGVVCQNHDDTLKLNVPPTAAFLVLVTGVLLLVLVVAALVLKCLIRKFKNKVPPREVDLEGSPSHANRRVNRVTLEPQGWSHTPAGGYSPLSNPAPPSYADTIRADREQVQHQTLQQATPLSCNHQDSVQTDVHIDGNSDSTNSDE